MAQREVAGLRRGGARRGEAAQLLNHSSPRHRSPRHRRPHHRSPRHRCRHHHRPHRRSPRHCSPQLLTTLACVTAACATAALRHHRQLAALATALNVSAKQVFSAQPLCFGKRLIDSGADIYSVCCGSAWSVLAYHVRVVFVRQVSMTIQHDVWLIQHGGSAWWL